MNTIRTFWMRVRCLLGHDFGPPVYQSEDNCRCFVQCRRCDRQERDVQHNFSWSAYSGTDEQGRMLTDAEKGVCSRCREVRFHIPSKATEGNGWATGAGM